MTAILRVESRKRLRSSLILLGVFVVLSAMYFSMFPGLEGEIDQFEEAFPDFFIELFGLEALDTIEGFIAAEVYSFFWVLLVGIYFAYLGAGMIAPDIRERKMDLTLSNPVSRESVVLQKVGGLWVPLVALNVGIPIVVFAGSVIIDETMNPVAIAMVHLLSVPYLLVCASLGLLFSVVTDRVRTARSAAIGAVVLLWIVDGASKLDEDFEWIGYLTPSRYYSETAILVREEYAYLDAGVLLLAFVCLLVTATMLFTRRDI